MSTTLVGQKPQAFAKSSSNLLEQASGTQLLNVVPLTQEDRVVPRYLSIKVEDTGIGMNHEQRDKLFKMFGMSGDAHIGVSGIGIGLTVCKVIVERMGGCIKVDSVIK